MERARRIYEPENLTTELNHLSLPLQRNGYKKDELKRYLSPKNPQERKKGEETATSKAFLPYISGVTDRIERLLIKYKAKTIYTPTRKLKDHFTSAKDKRDPLSVSDLRNTRPTADYK